eukprot:COSAG02_NODE_62761_length_265_cov_0.608434_1_plen_39_part_10
MATATEYSPGWILSGRLNHVLHCEELLRADEMVMALLVS